MLLLTSTSDILDLITSAAADVRVHVDYVDNLSGAITPARPSNASITTATTTTILSNPAASTQRNVKQIALRNVHASTSCDVTVRHTDGTTIVELIKVTLLAGESLVFDQTGDWQHYDTNGGLYAAFPAADQTAMEAATSNTRVVTPLNLNWHPSVAKFWVNFTGNSTTILASWNMTSITDGTTEATVTIATDFSSANWCCMATAEGTTSSSVGTARNATTRSIAAGSIIVFCIDGAATNAIQDPTRWHVCGFGDQ